MIGTLLEDLADGLGFDDVARRFRERMNPLQYQRPQAAPTAGAIKAAEQLVEQIGIAPALRRRYARVEELQALWKPSPAPLPKVGEGVFGHLVAKGGTRGDEIRLPVETMTWVKFRSNVMPGAFRIEYLAQPSVYAAMLTAEDPEAPPILQWDSEDARNPFSWYVYPNGSSPTQWGLEAGKFVDVTAIVLQPSLWRDENAFAHHGKGVFFILSGARDRVHGEPGSGLFPELMRSELHQVRSVIEAHSNSRCPEGREEATACGVKFRGGAWWNARFRVTSETGTREYTIDRWD